MQGQLARTLIRLLISSVARVKAEGLENIPSSGAYIIASNHLGRIDAALCYVIIDRTDLVMMVAEKYKKSPIWRWLVKQLDALWVDRFNADLVAMRSALNRLKAGRVLVMAPEGTRSPTGALIEARAGGSYLAAKAGVPIVPVAITGSQDHLVFGAIKHLRRAKVQACAGKPFILPPLKGKDRDAALQEYTDEIMCQIAALLPPEYRGVYADHPRLQELLAQS